MTMTQKTYTSPANELVLVDKAKADPAAFSALYEFYFAKVYNYVRYRVLDRFVADDLTSEIFESVLVKLHTYRPEKGPFSAWLFTIARNTVNYSLRRQKVKQWFSLEILRNQESREPKPDEAAAQSETNQELLKAISQLTEREREIIALKYTVGLTNRTISTMTGLKENHIATIVFRAVQRIRAHMESYGV
jgi:RNA polymerase sigma factor (sigma-70 family)